MLVLGSGCRYNEALLTHPPLTSCWAAQFLTGYRLIPVHGLGFGDPAVDDRKEIHLWHMAMEMRLAHNTLDSDFKASQLQFKEGLLFPSLSSPLKTLDFYLYHLRRQPFESEDLKTCSASISECGPSRFLS